MICRPRQWSSQLSKSEQVLGSHATEYFIKEMEEFSFSLWRCCLTRAMASSVLRFLDHTQRRTTVGRTPLDEWSACRRDLSLTDTTHNKLPCRLRDSEPQSQQASGRRPTHKAALLLGPAKLGNRLWNIDRRRIQELQPYRIGLDGCRCGCCLPFKTMWNVRMILMIM